MVCFSAVGKCRVRGQNSQLLGLRQLFQRIIQQRGAVCRLAKVFRQPAIVIATHCAPYCAKG